MLTLLVLQGPDKGRRFELPDEPALVGRGSRAIPLTDNTVSRRHCEIALRDGVLLLTDLGSANGTFINGLRVRSPQAVRVGDQLRVGRTLMVFGAAPGLRAAPADAGVEMLGAESGADSAIMHTVGAGDDPLSDSLVLAVPDPAAAASSDLQILYRLSSALASSFDAAHAMSITLDLVFGHLRADRGAVLLRDDSRPDGPLVTVVVRHRDPAATASPFRASRTIVDHVLTTGQGVLCSDASTDRRFSKGRSVHDLGIRSALCVPIKARRPGPPAPITPSSTTSASIASASIASGSSTPSAASIASASTCIASAAVTSGTVTRGTVTSGTVPSAVVPSPPLGPGVSPHPRSTPDDRAAIPAPTTTATATATAPPADDATGTPGFDVLGVLYIDSSVRNYTYSPDQLRLLSAIGSQAGLAVQNARLHHAQIRAERLAAVGETTAALSHSVKNILQALRGGADVVEMGLASDNLPQASKGWAIVTRNLARIQNLTANLLAYSRPRDAGDEPVDLSRLVRDAVETVALLAGERGAMVLAEPADATPPVPMDEAGIHQVLTNLLVNALEAGATVVRVSTSTDTDHALIDITDNGPGVAPEVRQHLFELFHSTKGNKGTGLGLAVSRKIAEEHGGSLDLLPPSTFPDPTQPSTTFRLRLPLAPPTPTDPSTA